MRKIRLELDRLRVETFVTGAGDELRGTVRARSSEGTYCGCETAATGDAACADPSPACTCSCYASCDGSPSCRLSCVQTCAATCQTCQGQLTCAQTCAEPYCDPWGTASGLHCTSC
jgi:hypothetical protein